MVYIKSRNLDIDIPDDNPFENDKLGREPLCSILTDAASFYGQSGCVMALNGEWGSGKTTFVKMWQAYLRKKGFKTLYFNAWTSDYTEDSLMALVAELSELSHGGELIDKIVSGIARIGLSFAKSALNKFTGIASEDIGDALDEASDICKKYIEEYSERKATLEEFKRNVTHFVADNAGNHPVVFFIDELDRCNPHYAVSVLERVKHLFEIPNVIFVLAVNKKELGNAIRGFYGSSQIDSDEYLRRFIDIEYNLANPDIETYCNYLYDQYNFSDFFRSKTRQNMRNYSPEDSIFKKFAYEMCKGAGTNLRQMDRIYSYARLALMQFQETVKFEVDIYFLLCFWKVMDNAFYEDIKKKRYSLQELLKELENRLPGVLLKGNYLATGIDIRYVVACLLYYYDISNPYGSLPETPSVQIAANASPGMSSYSLVSKYFDAESFDEALDHYFVHKQGEIKYGLQFIYRRIDLLSPFNV